MISANDVMRIYDTILSTPGMNDPVKLDLKVSRKQILLLSQVIEKGLAVKDDKDSLIQAADPDSLEELKRMAAECLQKAGLTELSLKISSLRETK